MKPSGFDGVSGHSHPSLLPFMNPTAHPSSLRAAALARGFAFVCALAFTLAFAAPEAVAAAPARERLFNDAWRFHLGDAAGAEKPDFADAAWRALDLPHDWSIEGEFSEDHASATGYLPGGTGWYRKQFVLPADTQGRRVFLRFEGVYRNSDVWLNGHHLGHRAYGYIDFEYDLTRHLRPPGQTNVLAVRVARENVADSRWYPGTGIYRDTWLTILDPIHVTRHGTFITTPAIDAEVAEVNSSCEVRNTSASAADITVTAEVFDAEGRRIVGATRTQKVEAGAQWAFPLYHPVAKPRRWDATDPYLYQVVHTVSVGDRVVDTVRTPLGIRDFRFNADTGFYLNGRNLKIKGVCIHHDAGNTGAVVPRAVLERRLRILRDIGVNAIRCSHNPMADDLYELCDELGFLMMDETFDEWELGKRKWVKGRNVGTAERAGYSDDFETWAVRDTEDAIRRSRRHPSVILYSIGNEIDYPTDPYVHPRSRQVEMFKDDPGQPSMTRLALVAPELIAAVKRMDPTRPVTMAISNAPAANAIGLSNMLDVVGYNYQEKAYDEDHARFPGRVLYGSENGDRLEDWHAVRDKPFISAQFLWTGFDFLGESGGWPEHGSSAGIFDTAGFAKTDGLRREALWSEKPVLHLRAYRPVRAPEGQGPGEGGRQRRRFGPAHWNAIPGNDEPAMVVAYTNFPEVTLSLNGRVIGTAKSEDGIVRWPSVPWEAGVLTATATPTTGATPVTATVETTGAPARLLLTADRATFAADNRDAVHVTIELVDADGRAITAEDRSVTVEVAGAARLLALDTGNLRDNTPAQSPTRSTANGRALAIIQATRTAGRATVKVTAPGLPPAEVPLTARPE